MAKPEEIIPQVCAWGSLLTTGLGLVGLVFPGVLPLSAGIAATLAASGCLGQSVTPPVKVKKKKSSYRDRQF